MSPTQHHMQTQTDAIDALRSEGFDHDAWLTDDGRVAVAPTGDASGDAETTCEASPLTIVETHRFEGASNPDDEAMVLGVETPDGSRAVLNVPYGPDVSGPQADAIREMFIAR